MNRDACSTQEPAKPAFLFRFFQRKATVPERPPLFQQLTHCLCAAVVAVSSYFMATHFVFQTVVVDGDSMVPTLRNSNRYLLNRVEYLFRDPAERDIVVIKDPEDGKLSIKRIVAMGGDTVELAGGEVYVNGRRQIEPYLLRGTRTFSYRVYDHEKFVLAKGEYFVLGDNRGNSADSRIYGGVPRENILGIVVP